MNKKYPSIFVRTQTAIFLALTLSISHSVSIIAADITNADSLVIVDETLQKKLADIENALRKGGSDSFRSLSDLVSSMLFVAGPEAKKHLESLARQHSQFQSVFGDNIGVERIGGIKLGESMLSVVFVWKMKEAATVWYFNFYKGENEWKLISFASETMGAFLDRPDKLLTLGRQVTLPTSVQLPGSAPTTVRP